jgi:hypothetical protein
MNGGNSREHADREGLRERLSAYLDGELEAGDAAALERHLRGCAECRAELAALREVRSLLSALPQPALPRSFALPASAAARARRVPSAAASWPAAESARTAGRRAPTGRASVSALARTAQWIGSVAAACGLLLLLSTAVLGAIPNASPNSSAMGPISGASGPAHAGTNPQQTASMPTPHVVATPVTTPGVAQGVGTPAQGTPAPGVGTPAQASHQVVPLPTAGESLSFPIVGAGLFIGGIVLLAMGTVTARRRQMPAH